ncbi:gas vesicle protein GvpG [Tardiphaga sp.]|uniref:gas vesicle protein GvpG n=1 Tax=Tardiphaga sp. TaxID=1926292 RepID=UPI001991E36C|nr:gas vesicle protein GvpG [Tardiphaga sp.]MBC7577755.1 gas vesicle protein GvpG [Tardiphaga sp.]
MLFKLLTLPISLPIDAVGWIGNKITEAAEQQLYDTEAIKRQLEALEERLVSEELTEVEFEELELMLINRLREANRRLRAVGP